MNRPRGCSNSNLDNLWSKRVKDEAGNECELCKAGFLPSDNGPLCSHHFYGRRDRAMRWFIPNGVCLCVPHHLGDKLSAHKNPAWFQRQMEKIRGTEWLDNLIERKQIIFKWQQHLLEIKSYLNGELEDYL